MTRVTRISLSVMALGLLLAGCDTSGPLRNEALICDALVGPIKYNSTVMTSLRHAGVNLAPDLALRNRIGRELHCPKYK